MKVNDLKEPLNTATEQDLTLEWNDVSVFTPMPNKK
jgi:ABC-type multidrug transport system ATPase subunit